MALDAFGGCTSALAICERDGTVADASRVFVVGKKLGDHVGAGQRAAVDAVIAAGVGRADAVIEGRWHQLEIAQTADGRLAVIAAEIDERKAAEGMMIDTHGVAHLGTWEWDITQPHAWWSPELYNIYGLTPETYTPSYEAYLTKIHPDDRAHVMAATEQVFTKHQPYSHDERIYRPDGSIRYLHTWARAITDEHGTLKRLIGVCQDITERKVAELEREKVEKQLLQAQKLEALGRVTGGIAHDFNNILNVIVGYASILERHVEPKSQQREHVREIMGAAERASRMTGELLAFSRDHSLARRAPLDLDQMIEDLAPLVASLVGAKVAVVRHLAGGLVVEANPSQLEQIVMNLAVNARDAMPEGGTLTITTRAAAAAGEGDERVEMIVEDTGVGMSEAVRAQIFDPFFTTKEVGRGTGLGLSTVYGIVTQSGGTIDVTSAVGRGTQFAISLPRIARGTLRG